MGMQRPLCAVVIGTMAMTLVATVSCHNDYEEWGQRKADSAFEVSRYEDDFDEMRGLLKEYSEDHEMEFFDETIHHPEHGDLVTMQIGRPSSVLILVRNGTLDSRLIVLIFGDRSNPASWRPYEADLKRRLRNRFGALDDITEKPPEQNN